MKKRKMYLIAVVIVMVFMNVLLSTPIINNKSQLSLILLSAKADGNPIENRDPVDDPIPDGTQPEEWLLSSIISYLFN